MKHFVDMKPMPALSEFGSTAEELNGTILRGEAISFIQKSNFDNWALFGLENMPSVVQRYEDEMKEAVEKAANELHALIRDNINHLGPKNKPLYFNPTGVGELVFFFQGKIVEFIENDGQLLVQFEPVAKEQIALMDSSPIMVRTRPSDLMPLTLDTRIFEIGTDE